MNQIRSNDTETMCAVCGRTILLGERLVTFHRLDLSAEAGVCELCVEEADARGWLRDGTPTVPLRHLEDDAPHRRIRSLFAQRRRPRTAVPYEPEELPDTPGDAVHAGLELFNESKHPRTVSGIARTLGDPRVSVVPRSTREVVVTVAWDLSWYQYRVDMLGAQPVTLQSRGEELAEIDGRFQDWNATAEPDGTLALAV